MFSQMAPSNSRQLLAAKTATKQMIMTKISVRIKNLKILTNTHQFAGIYRKQRKRRQSRTPKKYKTN